jgi:transcriptional regulator with XRE-family HTH domain
MKLMAEAQKDLITNIKHEMFRWKLEVPDVAVALGVSGGWVYKLLAGNAESITFDHLDRLARLFNTTPGSLMGAPIAKDKPTIHEAFDVLREEFERMAKQPDLSRVPPDLLSRIAVASEAEFRAITVALEGAAIGKEAAKALKNKGTKSKSSAS